MTSTTSGATGVDADARILWQGRQDLHRPGAWRPHLQQIGADADLGQRLDQRRVAAGERDALVRRPNVPIIGQASSEVGRRFVTLVDALYEARGRLVVLAEAVPEQLFEQVVSEDQRRTVSRLNEMKHVDWNKRVR